MYAMNTNCIRLGLIGKDVSKSTSAQIHKFILGEWGIACEYEKFSVSPAEFDTVMRRLIGDFDGFNVTIPYKRDVFSYLNGIHADAVSCGAVNTVITQSLRGYNTDGVGFLLMLETAKIEVRGKRVLVLGAGGAGRSTAVALKNAGANVFMYRRNQTELQEVCIQLGVTAVEDPEVGGFDILINCTGVGMHDSEGVSPVTEKAFEGAKTAIDLIYTPEKSAFLEIAEQQGLQILNGAAMLFYQAYYADCLYTERKASASQAEILYKKYLQMVK